MTKVDEAIATFERNIEIQTGKSITQWLALLGKQNLDKHGKMVTWLKADHQLSHSHANHIAKRRIEANTPRSDDDPVAHLFEGGKEPLRHLYDHIAGYTMKLGADVEIVPKKANASVRRAKQFALIQVSTKTRLDLGLILKGKEPEGRLEASGSFNAMFTHRIKLSSIEEFDKEIKGWLKDAYRDAG